MHRLGVKRSSSTFSEQAEDERTSPPTKRLRRSPHCEVVRGPLSSSIGALFSSTWSWLMSGLRKVIGSPQERNIDHQQTTKEVTTNDMEGVPLEDETTEWSPLVTRELEPFTLASLTPSHTQSLFPTSQTHSIQSHTSASQASSVTLVSSRPTASTPVTSYHIKHRSTPSLQKQHCTVSKPPSLFSTVLSPEVIGPQTIKRDLNSSVRQISHHPLPSLSTPSISLSTPPMSHTNSIFGSFGGWRVPASIKSSGHYRADTISKQVQTSYVTGHATTKTQHLPEANRIKKWLEDFKSTHKHSVEEHRAILEVAEKKLRIHQQDRLAIEDARVSRLRKILGLTTITDDVPGKRELNLEETLEERATVVALLQGQPNDCLSQKFNIRITRGDLRTLSGLQWLNDEVINFYLNLIKEHSGKEGRPTVHVFSTFFYPKLSQFGYSGVRRWTKKVDVFAHDLLLVPVHMGMHWCLAVVDFQKKQFQYYDSLSGSNPACFKRLKEYLVMESRDKRHSEYSIDEWTCINRSDIPCQENGSDCGVFTCMYARHLSSDSSFEFSQQMMPAIRGHMMIEIVKQCLL